MIDFSKIFLWCESHEEWVAFIDVLQITGSDLPYRDLDSGWDGQDIRTLRPLNGFPCWYGLFNLRAGTSSGYGVRFNELPVWAVRQGCCIWRGETFVRMAKRMNLR